MKSKICLNQRADWDDYFYELSQGIKNVIVEIIDKYTFCRLDLKKEDLKGKHGIDELLYKAIKKFIIENGVPASVYIETEEPLIRDKADFSIFIDPVDGSLNRDLGVGDPAIAVTFSFKEKPKFIDICYGYVYGLHSEDTYFTKGGKSYFKRKASAAIEIQCDKFVKRLKDAILYYNDGYGGEFALNSLKRAGALPLFVKHHNAFDNTAMEICQICRGAAHLRVEARSYEKDGRQRGSEHANMLAAFSIGKNAGLIVTDLNGAPLDEVYIDLDKPQDFICGCGPELLKETIGILERNKHILAEKLEED
ncbi:MAG: hypothetical protein ABH836_04060 [Candidatus Omnitrophota bacterium]